MCKKVNIAWAFWQTLTSSAVMMIIDGTWRIAIGVSAHWQVSVAMRLHTLVGSGGFIEDAPVCGWRVQVRAIWTADAWSLMGTNIFGSWKREILNEKLNTRVFSYTPKFHFNYFEYCSYNWILCEIISYSYLFVIIPQYNVLAFQTANNDVFIFKIKIFEYLKN